jgi:hypothetical protein
LNTTVAGNLTNNPLTTEGTNGCSKAFLNKLVTKIMDHDLPAYGLLMRFSSFKDLRDWDRDEVDPVTMREILETGLYGQLWGIDLIVSRRVAAGNVFALTEPRFFGVMPVRTELILMPDDQPREAVIGYIGYEEIGQAALNGNGISKGIHNIIS